MRTFTLAVGTLAAVSVLGTGSASAQTYEDAIDCFEYIERVSSQLAEGSDARKQALELRKSWQTTASLLAEDDSDPDALKDAASARFWDVMQNGTRADQQAYHQSFNKCAAPPAISETSIPAKNCARFALYLREHEESTRKSWVTYLEKQKAEGASEAELSETRASIVVHDENVKRAGPVYLAWLRENTGVRLEADTLGVYGPEERAEVLDACEAG